MPAKRRSGRSGNSSFRKRSRRQPVASRDRKGDGILSFKRHIWSAAASAARRRFGLSESIFALRQSKAPSSLRSAGALQIFIAALVATLFFASCSRIQNKNSLVTTREVTDEAGRRVR